MITIRHDVAYHPEALKVIPAIMRSLSKPTKKGFNKTFRECLRRRDTYTPSGIYLGKVSTYMPDYKRLEKVAERIIRGLFYHHTGSSLSGKYEVRVIAIDSYDESDIEISISVRNIIDSLSSCFAGVNPITIGDGVFTYWHTLPNKKDSSSYWLLIFYERIPFVGTTQLKGKQNT